MEMPWKQNLFPPQAHIPLGLGLSYLLQGLQHSLAVHLQDVQFGLILHPPIRHHGHQVEADVMVGLPAGTVDISLAPSKEMPCIAPATSFQAAPPLPWPLTPPHRRLFPQSQVNLTLAGVSKVASAITQSTLRRLEGACGTHLLQPLLQQDHPELVVHDHIHVAFEYLQGQRL